MTPYLLALTAVVLSTGALRAETVLSDVTGNWAAPKNDGYFYRAVLTQEGEYLRLRIYQGMSADTIEAEPQFDNPKIAYAAASAGPGGKDWLEVGAQGELYLSDLTVNEGYAYTERLMIRMMDNQFTAMAFEQTNNGPDSVATMPDHPVGCWTDSCYSCKADLWNVSAVAGGESITLSQPDFAALNASLWTPDRIYELGFCPAPN